MSVLAPPSFPQINQELLEVMLPPLSTVTTELLFSLLDLTCSKAELSSLPIPAMSLLYSKNPPIEAAEVVLKITVPSEFT